MISRREAFVKTAPFNGRTVLLVKLQYNQVSLIRSTACKVSRLVSDIVMVTNWHLHCMTTLLLKPLYAQFKSLFQMPFTAFDLQEAVYLKSRTK